VVAVWVFAHRIWLHRICQLLCNAAPDLCQDKMPLRAEVPMSAFRLIQLLAQAGIPFSVVYQREGDIVHIPIGNIHAGQSLIPSVPPSLLHSLTHARTHSRTHAHSPTSRC